MPNEGFEGFDRFTMEAADMDLYERTELPLDEIWGCVGDSARDVYQLFGVDVEEDDEDEFYWDEDWMEE